MERDFDYYNGSDILEKSTLTEMNDRSLFDGASTNNFRRHFQQWSLKAYQAEQHPGENTGQASPTMVKFGRSPRYRFAVQVDVAALHSLLHDAPTPREIDTTKKGWVKLIDKSWSLGRNVADSDAFEPVEGRTENDVGWMKVPYHHATTKCYANLRSPNDWGVHYCRPPRVAGWPYNE